MEGVRIAGPEPAGPAESSGPDARPLYAFTYSLTAGDLSKFYRAHLSFHHRRGMNIVCALGFLLIGLGAGEYFILHGTEGYVFELGCGLGFVALSFFLGPLTARSAVRNWKGPTQTRYRFFSDGYESSRDGALERRTYGSIVEILLTCDAVYLYAEKDRAFILPREALGDELEAFSAFLEAKSGRKAARVGRRKAV